MPTIVGALINRSSQFCFSDVGLVFSGSDPILFADMATCDWLH